MDPRAKIQKQINLKKDEVDKIQEKINELKSEQNAINGIISGLEEALGYLPKETKERDFYADVKNMRQDSDVAYAFNFINKKNEPVYIDDILKGIGKEVTKENRHALAGQLSYNVREKRIFTRPDPNTFGLIEWGYSDNSTFKSKRRKRVVRKLPEELDLPDAFGIENDDFEDI